MIWLLLLIIVFVVVGGGVWGWPLVAGVLGATSIKDKPGALNYIVQLMHTWDINPAEVEAAFHAPVPDEADASRGKGNVVKTLFIYLGAIFILAGIGTYVANFWGSMGSAMRVLVTLGVGYVMFIVLVSALYEGKYPRIILPLALASVFAMTSGWFVLIHEVFPHGDNWRAATLTVFGVMAVHQGVLFARYQLTVLAFTSLFFVYGFMHVGLDMIDVPVAFIAIFLGISLYLVASALEKTPHRVLAEPGLFIASCWLYAGLFDRIAIASSVDWACLIIGVCVLCTAYGFQKAQWYARLAGFGYFIGSVIAYGALFDMVRDTSFELAYLGVTASMLYASVVLQSRALLFTTVIAMLGFIGYFTARYFADSLGWPITLVLMGVAFLGVGTIAINAKRRMTPVG